MKNSLIFILCFITFGLYAQDLPLLEDIQLETKEDHLNFEDNILEYISWLENNSLKHKKRKKINAVFLKWIIGTPTVSISLPKYVRDYTKRNEGFLVLFMTGYSKYVLNKPGEKSNVLAGNLAGVHSFLDFYERGRKGVKKDKEVERLLKIREAGQLEEFIISKLN